MLEKVLLEIQNAPLPTVDDEPHSGFEIELAAMINELHSFKDVRDSLLTEGNSLIYTTK